jgi:hypothetical protein
VTIPVGVIANSGGTMKHTVILPIVFASLGTAILELPCGFADAASLPSCEYYEVELPCHYWVESNSGDRDRDTSDWHIQYPDEMPWYLWVGPGLASQHPSPCDPIPPAPDLLTAIEQKDAVALQRYIEGSQRAWLEFNAERNAVQVLAACPGKSAVVVGHVRVRADLAEYWREALSESGTLN